MLVNFCLFPRDSVESTEYILIWDNSIVLWHFNAQITVVNPQENLVATAWFFAPFENMFI